MLVIVTKVLSIFGIVLLAVLAAALFVLLLLLFFPFTYRVCGSKDAISLRLTAKVNWLFGLFRIRLRYPQPGRLTAKLLCFSLLDIEISPKKEGEQEQEEAGETAGGEEPAKDKLSGAHSREEEASGAGSVPADRESAETVADSRTAQEETEEPSGETASESPAQEPSGKISQKIRKIKYTIYNIYDKIEKIWKNISYYTELLREENTRQLAAHAFLRIRKVLKSFRPRHVRVQLLFGTGSPDTTGCLYGAYCALSAPFGAGFWVTPDFEQKRLEGEFDVAGHVILWVLVINALKLVLDKKLRLFLAKWKRGQKKPKKAAA